MSVNSPISSASAEILDRREGLGVDQDLAGLRLAAQPRREVHHRADRRVVVAALEADLAERGVAVRDADAEAELVAELAPFDGELRHRVAHLDRHADGAQRRLVDLAPDR